MEAIRHRMASTKRAAAARESLHKCWRKPPICHRGETDAIHVFGRTQAAVTDQRKFRCCLIPPASGSEENPNFTRSMHTERGKINAREAMVLRRMRKHTAWLRLEDLPPALLSKPVYN